MRKNPLRSPFDLIRCGANFLPRANFMRGTGKHTRHRRRKALVVGSSSSAHYVPLDRHLGPATRLPTFCCDFVFTESCSLLEKSHPSCTIIVAAVNSIILPRCWRICVPPANLESFTVFEWSVIAALRFMSWVYQTLEWMTSRLCFGSIIDFLHIQSILNCWMFLNF